MEASPEDAHTVLSSTCSQEPVQTVGRAHRGPACRAGAGARSRGARGTQEEGVGAPLSPAPVAKNWWSARAPVEGPGTLPSILLAGCSSVTTGELLNFSASSRGLLGYFPRQSRKQAPLKHLHSVLRANPTDRKAVGASGPQGAAHTRDSGHRTLRGTDAHASDTPGHAPSAPFHTAHTQPPAHPRCLRAKAREPGRMGQGDPSLLFQKSNAHLGQVWIDLRRGRGVDRVAQDRAPSAVRGTPLPPQVLKALLCPGLLLFFF